MLEVRDLQCWRNDKKLFSSLAFKLNRGSVLQITGPNGSGKTTLLRILAGLHRPTQGSMLWKEQPVAFDAHYLRNISYNLAYLGHKPGIKAGLTALEFLKHTLAGEVGVKSLLWTCKFVNNRDLTPVFPPIFQSRDLTPFLHTVGLKGFEKELCGTFSEGQKQRLALARLLIQPKFLWLLDEPFSHLDTNGRILLKTMIRNHCKEGNLVVMVSHEDLDFGDFSAGTLNLENSDNLRNSDNLGNLDNLENSDNLGSFK